MHFTLKYPELAKIDDQSKYLTDPRFRMVFASPIALNGAQKWALELEVETVKFQSNTPPRNNCPPHCITGQLPTQKKAQFSFQNKNSYSHQVQKPNDAPIILDICVMPSTVDVTCHPKKPFGFFSDDLHRHNMYYMRNIAADLRAQSLSELITKSSNYFQKPTADRFLLTLKQRLRLAVNLASGVLQFHGSWLKADWRAKDIMFNTSAEIDSPFVEWNVGRDGDV